MSDEILKELIYSAWKANYIKNMGTPIGLPEPDSKFIDGFKAGLKSVSELELEITKLKEEIQWRFEAYDKLDDVNIKLNHEIFELKSEITKLKKSREVLREASKFYGNWTNGQNDKIIGSDFEVIFMHEPLPKDKNGVAIAGKKAREALKQDHEIMYARGTTNE